MVRYLLYISYIGTRYRGAQKGLPKASPILDPDSIQGALECALLSLFPRSLELPSITLSSRTDAGVHALESAVHADVCNPSGLICDPDTFIAFMNRYMTKCDHDIRVLRCIPVTDKFHARYKAISRTYLYRFMVPKKDNEFRIPIGEKCQSAFVHHKNFDIDRVKSGIKHFYGVKNFETFCTRSKNVYEKKIVYVRKLDHFTIEEASPLIPFDPLSNNFNYYMFSVKAKSFLYNQVRRMVGSLLGLGSGLITESELLEMITVPNQKNWNPKVSKISPYGLYLKKVEYDEQDLESYKLFPEEDKSYEAVQGENLR